MEKLPKKYISVDVEASGKYPWNSSMLSFGACVVDGKFDKTFYAELKPLSRKYVYDNFRIGCSSLDILKDYNFDNFNPEEVLDLLYKQGQNPSDVMSKFAFWIISNTKGHRPVICSDNLLFDGMFVLYYFSNLLNDGNIFGHSVENIQSVFRGKANDMSANLEELSLRESGKLRHNALQDAINHAREFHTALTFMRHKY